ncbi:hypothetical protein [Nonomuraea dietziae]|uniref:hypothetical protein n=1 Tax=Nonomuraea dietziae TaxID=65515 RepID=UPI00342B6E60
MTPLERRYRRLMRAYPRSYRSAYGEELLDILLGHTDPARTTPPLKEAAGLLVNGMRERAWQAARGPAWTDGLHLGVTALSVAHLATLLPYAAAVPGWLALSALTLALVVLGRARLALPLASLTAVKMGAIGTGAVFLDATLLPVEPGFLLDHPLYGYSGLLGAATGPVLNVAGLGILAWRGRPLRRRSLWWAPAALLVAGADPAWMALSDAAPGALLRVTAEAAVLAGAVWAGRLTGDLRWALAAALYLAATSAAFGEHLLHQSRQDLAYWGVLALFTLLAAVVPYGARTRAID